MVDTPIGHSGNPAVYGSTYGTTTSIESQLYSRDPTAKPSALQKIHIQSLLAYPISYFKPH